MRSLRCPNGACPAYRSLNKMKTGKESTMKRDCEWIAGLSMLFMLAFSLPSWAQAPAGTVIDPQALQEMSARTPRIPMLSVKPKALFSWLASSSSLMRMEQPRCWQAVI